MTIFNHPERYTERDSRSPVYSHQEGFNDPVHTICHHSGRYLTYLETNPTVRLILREQHDFPGLPKLDRSFAKAAHSRQHEHWIWSKPGIQGAAMLLSGVVVLAVIYRISMLKDFVPAGIWLWLFWLVVAIAAGSSIVFAGYGLMLITQRETMFHQRAQGMPPATPDFPIECTYEIEIEENLKAPLGNVGVYFTNDIEQIGCIKTTLYPVQNDLETYAQYQEQYKLFPVGRQIMAGTIALSGLRGINLLSPTMDFDHRIILLTSATNLKFDRAKEIYEPLCLTTDYTISPSILHTQHKGLKQFPLQCEPKISHDDSRTLELHFTWQPSKNIRKSQNLRIFLEECILDLDSISDDCLKPATHVQYGRYDHENERVIWRNLEFHKTDNREKWYLNLKVTFEFPILNCLEHIVGKYKLRLNGLVSNLQVNSDHIWTAWGLKAGENDSLIRERANIQGELRINTQLLSQEHEHVTNTEPIICALPPDVYLIEKVLNVIQDEGFEVRQVLQAPTRLHPTGRLDARLQYWDVVGRRYNPQTLDAIDIHIVISGYDHVSRLSTKGKFPPQTQIDVRLRCLHDPRNEQTPKQADILIGQNAANEPNGRLPIQSEIPFHLRNRLYEILRDCGPFRNDRTLRSIFVDSRISQWQEHLPEANTIAERIVKIRDFLYSRNGKDGKNALVSLLEVLKERLDSSEGCSNQLERLIQELSHLPEASKTSTSNVLTIVRQDPEMLGLVNRIKQTLLDETDK